MLALQELNCKFIEVDEIWSFVYARKGTETEQECAGDLWTFSCICPDTKLVPCWYIGERTKQSAIEFLTDLKSRLSGRVQISTDGFPAYKDAVEQVFGKDVDLGRLMKQYSEKKGNQVRGKYQGAHKDKSIGCPDEARITTAHIERQNLNMRNSISRFRRKTSAFSKKAESHCDAVALHFMYHNFCRIHTSLRVTPAMEAGIEDHVWSIEEMLEMCDEMNILEEMEEL